MIWGMLWSFSDSKGPPSAPQGPRRFQIDDLVFHEKSRYKIALWDKSTMGNWVLVAWKADKGIFDDLGHVLVIFWPPTAPRGPQWSHMGDLVFLEKLR